MANEKPAEKPSPYGTSVQVPPEAYKKLSIMAANHPRAKLRLDGVAEPTDKRGVSRSVMVGLCIEWAWEALQQEKTDAP